VLLLSLLGSQKYKAKYGSGTPAQPSTPAATLAPAGSAPSGSELVGQSATVPGSFSSGTLQGVVTDAKRGISLPGVSPAGTFLAVFLKVTNAGTKPADVGIFSFSIVDSKGRQFTLPESIDVQIAAEKQYSWHGTYSTIQPSLSDNVVLVFDIAPDATGLKLVAGKP
jgi:hypothetical protein